MTISDGDIVHARTAHANCIGEPVCTEMRRSTPPRRHGAPSAAMCSKTCEACADADVELGIGSGSAGRGTSCQRMVTSLYRSLLCEFTVSGGAPCYLTASCMLYHPMPCCSIDIIVRGMLSSATHGPALPRGFAPRCRRGIAALPPRAAARTRGRWRSGSASCRSSGTTASSRPQSSRRRGRSPRLAHRMLSEAALAKDALPQRFSSTSQEAGRP